MRYASLYWGPADALASLGRIAIWRVGRVETFAVHLLVGSAGRA